MINPRANIRVRVRAGDKPRASVRVRVTVSFRFRAVAES